VHELPLVRINLSEALQRASRPSLIRNRRSTTVVVEHVAAGIFLHLPNSEVWDTFRGTAVQGHVPERVGGGCGGAGSGDVRQSSRTGSDHARPRSRNELDKRFGVGVHDTSHS
jgi:hypothetical protein